MKRCTRCQTDKPFHQFPRSKQTTDGYFPYCRECKRAYRREKHGVDPEAENVQKRAWYAERKATQAAREVFPNTLKQCGRCDETKPVAQFYRAVANADGFSSWCKTCTNEKRAQWDKEHPKEARAHRKQNHERHKDEWNAKRREDRKDNLEEEQARDRARYAVDPEPFKQRSKQYREDHPEERAEQRRKRRAAIVNAPINDFTTAQWHAMLTHYGYRCVYCRRKMKHLTQDHIIPLSKDGSHTWSNIVPACTSCNSKKHNGGVLVPIQPLLLFPPPRHK